MSWFKFPASEKVDHMATLLRAMRPQRIELKKTIEQKPLIRGNFEVSQERDAYIVDLQVYHGNSRKTSRLSPVALENDGSNCQ